MCSVIIEDKTPIIFNHCLVTCKLQEDYSNQIAYFGALERLRFTMARYRKMRMIYLKTDTLNALNFLNGMQEDEFIIKMSLLSCE